VSENHRNTLKMTLSAILLGLIDIAIVVAVLLLIGACIEWALSAIASIAIPPNVRKGFLLVVALVALYMLVALLLGIPSIRLLGR
jgi:hypothetical protein